MDSAECLRVSDPAVVARYLQLRSLLHDRHLARVEHVIAERYEVQSARRLHPTLLSDVRGGFVRPELGELWPVVFLTAVDVCVALCVAIDEDRVAGLGTSVKGPQRIRHRGWEGWWGWESPLAGLHPQFFDLPAQEQEDAVTAWYTANLEWLVHAGLLRRGASSPS
jgi:hypothetical protein